MMENRGKNIVLTTLGLAIVILILLTATQWSRVIAMLDTGRPVIMIILTVVMTLLVVVLVNRAKSRK